MKEKLKALEESVSLADAEMLSNELASFDVNYSLTDDEQQRILSSVMRKAGFEMDKTISMKKTRRHRKRFAGFVIAAALLTSGAVGAGAYAYYNKGLVNYSKAVYNNSDEETVKSIEQVEGIGGSCIENSFDELDIQLDTTLNMSDLLVAVFTVSKKDGTPFESVEGYRYKAGISSRMLFINGIAYGGYENDVSNVFLNDDGTLTLLMACSGIDFSEESGHSLEECSCRIKLRDLYLIPDYDYWYENGGGEEYIRHEDELRKLLIELQNDYFTETFDAFGEYGLTEDELYKAENLSEDYYKKLDSYLSARKEQSKDSYYGTAVFKIDDMSDRSPHGSASGIDVTANPFSIKAAGKGDPRELFKDHTPKFEIHMRSGELIDIPVDKNFISWSSGTDGYIWDYVYQFEDRPINVSNIDYVVFDGMKIAVS